MDVFGDVLDKKLNLIRNVAYVETMQKNSRHWPGTGSVGRGDWRRIYPSFRGDFMVAARDEISSIRAFSLLFTA